MRDRLPNPHLIRRGTNEGLYMRDNPVKCPFCGGQFSNGGQLKRHVSKMHPQSDMLNES